MNRRQNSFRRQTFRKGLGIFLAALLVLVPPPAFGTEKAPLLKKLKEHPASLHSDNLKVSLLLRGIGQRAGINIVVAGNIDDTISLNIDHLNLYEIFHVIMDAKQLDYYQKNNVVFVEKRGDFAAKPQDMITVRLCTQYGNAADYLQQLNPLLTPSGSITVASRGNCLVVRERETNIERIEQMLAELDKPVPQVHIEARIVTITTEAKKRLGIIWGYDNLQQRNSVTASAALPATSLTTNLTFGFLRDNLDLDFELQALQQNNMLEILSSPRILVIDGKEAEIKQGKEVPYVTQSGDIINTSFREANLSLKVTPQVIQNDFINLEVFVSNDSVDQSSSASGEPLINKQQISTNLFLENSKTVVIGGILLETKDNQNSSVPGLSAIPLLGNLFKNTERLNEKTELLVFITPTIVSLKATAAQDGKGRDYRRKVLGRQKNVPLPQTAEELPRTADQQPGPGPAAQTLITAPAATTTTTQTAPGQEK